MRYLFARAMPPRVLMPHFEARDHEAPDLRFHDGPGARRDRRPRRTGGGVRSRPVRGAAASLHVPRLPGLHRRPGGGGPVRLPGPVLWESPEELLYFTESRFAQCWAPVEPFLVGPLRV